MGLVFWDVDTQVDFMLPEGKLYVPGAEKIIPNLKRLTQWAGENRVPVIASACAHVEGDQEFQMFPPHCLVGTAGQHKISETTLPGAAIVPNRPGSPLPDPASCPQVVIEKQQFNVFSNPNTEALLRRLPPEPEIVLYGVVTEICVAAAALGLLQRGCRVRLVRDAIQYLDEFKAHTFLREARERGATLTTTREVLAGAWPVTATARKASNARLPRASKR